MIITKNQVSKTVANLFEVPNPKYFDLLKLGKETRFCKKTVFLSSGEYLPPGAAYWSKKIDNKRVGENTISLGSLGFPNSNIELRDYQIEPFNKAMAVRCALIHAPTGSGKSIISANLIKETGLTTLVVCHSADLMMQFKETFKEFLGIEAGLFYGAKKNIKNVTITTYASAKKNAHIFNERNFGMLHIDEADLFFTPSCLKFLNEFKARRKYAFTATPRKEKYDDLMKGEKSLMSRIWGYTVKVETKMQIDVLKEIRFKSYDKEYKEEFIDETGKTLSIPIPPREWHKFRTELDVDMDRKREQIDWVLGNQSVGDSSIVLLDRVKDVESFYAYIKEVSNIEVYTFL